MGQGGLIEGRARRLMAEGFDVVVHRSGPTFGRVVVSKGRFCRSELKVDLGKDLQMSSGKC